MNIFSRVLELLENMWWYRQSENPQNSNIFFLPPLDATNSIMSDLTDAGMSCILNETLVPKSWIRQIVLKIWTSFLVKQLLSHCAWFDVDSLTLMIWKRDRWQKSSALMFATHFSVLSPMSSKRSSWVYLFVPFHWRSSPKNMFLHSIRIGPNVLDDDWLAPPKLDRNPMDPFGSTGFVIPTWTLFGQLMRFFALILYLIFPTRFVLRNTSTVLLWLQNCTNNFSFLSFPISSF